MSSHQNRFSTEPFVVHGRTYCPPAQPLAVICIDGCADEYLSESLLAGCMPQLETIIRDGYRGLVRGALPSFTNVNNSSIVTGVTPAVTGISGNFFLDPESGEEVMMNSSRFLRCETLLAAASQQGRKVAMVTAKEKLRDILSSGLAGIAFSAEKADQAALETHGIENVPTLVGQPVPEIYSADASLFVLQAGVALVQQSVSDFLYLSLTDYMQHKYAPHEQPSLDFYAGMDREIGRLRDLGCVLGITADHGMNAKNSEDGSPQVIYLETILREEFGDGIKVICPITDPYVVHHGALGSLVMIHLDDLDRLPEISQWLWNLPGVSEVYDRTRAARKLELPEDRIGDLTVLAGRNWVLGRTTEYHDLTNLQTGLRSHGGRYEEMVPMVLSRPLSTRYRQLAEGDPRNFDIFDFTCNGSDG
ncbi:MAG: phosphonoacetate hydrolase [Pirellulaceae bacterium]|nr:phosphonoacetate hydrolase [Pirellulaceae bacterium]